MAEKKDWLKERLTYLRGLKAPSDYQRLLLLLADKPGTERNEDEERKLSALVKAERAAERAQKAKAAAAKIASETEATQRKTRNHELYQSAGLMILAGLLEKKTGKPTTEKAILLGGLIALKETLDNANEDHRSICDDWREKGATLLSAKSSADAADAKETVVAPAPAAPTPTAPVVAPAPVAPAAKAPVPVRHDAEDDSLGNVGEDLIKAAEAMMSPKPKKPQH